MIEVWTGRAQLSETVEKAWQTSHCALRIGLDHGHDLEDPWQRKCLQALVAMTCPRHVWTAWQCKYLSSWSQYNEHRSEETYLKIAQGRRQSKFDLDLVVALAQLQRERGDHLHGENPMEQLSLEASRYSTVPPTSWF